MLHLYFEDEKVRPDIELIEDVELQFNEIDLTGSDVEKAILFDIDKAQYNGKGTIIDRFGNRLYKSELSTGSKAALIVLRHPDKLINTIECGLNALSTIIVNCNTGNILLYDFQSPFESIDGDDKTIDVVLDKYRFTSLFRLNQYICSERPFDPVMNGGIEYA